MYWTLIVLVLSFLLTAFLLWKEFKRTDKAWLWVRIASSLLAVTGLACLALPFNIHTKKWVSTSEVVLLTEGYNRDSVKQLIKRYKVEKVFALSREMNDFNAVYLPDISKLKKQGLSIHVIGNGLTRHELDQLDSVPFRLYPSQAKNNFLSIGWNSMLTSGEQLHVQGRFTNSSSSATKILLSGMGANLDSVTVPGNQTSVFQLKTVPRHIDKAVYSITALSGSDTVASEPVPLNVKSTTPLRIFLLASSPDFENKFLKNWLSENGYQFAAKTIISANKFNKEFENQPAAALDRITPALLEKFDLVIADMSALIKLPSSDLAAMRSYVADKGLGLVVKVDSLVKSSSFYALSFPLVEIRDSVQHSIKLRFVGSDNPSLPLIVDQPVYIRNVAGTQPLIQDQQLRLVASSTALGMGRIILTTVPNTYAWQLSGNKPDYSRYWTTLLTKAAKKTAIKNHWSTSPVMPSLHDEVHLQLQASDATIPKVLIGESKVAMEQDIYLPYKWTATYWPTTTGWQTITNSDGTVDWWYVYGAKDWAGVKAAEKIRANNAHANRHPPPSERSSPKSIDVQKEFPKIYFFILFVICCGVLWFEKKLHNH